MTNILLPMSETMMYMLFALKEERHGYGIMQCTKEITKGRIELGAGTIYQTLAKLEKNKLIVPTKEIDRKKYYRITELGLGMLKSEIERIKEIYLNMEVIL